MGRQPSLLLILFWGSVVGGHCPLGNWIRIQGNCFLFSTQGLTWDQASADCRHYGATLMQFYGADDRKLFTRTVANMTSERWWTALNDIGHPGGWVWGKDDSQVLANEGAVVWNVDPDDRHHIENCGAINIQGTVSDQECSERHGYICEFNLSIGGGCPFHWMTTATNCYYVSDLDDAYNVISWQDASNKCNQLHPNSSVNLLRLETANEQAYIRRQLANLKMTDQLYWIGMTDQAWEGHWTWDNGAAVNQPSIEWTIEPNNLGGTEQCALIYDNGRFADADCKRVEKYVCQTPNIADSSVRNQLGCMNGWVRAGHKCYYFQIQRTVNHKGATSACVAKGGRLLQIQTQDEKDWIELQTQRYAAYPFWNGLVYDTSSSSWLWNGGTKANMSLVRWNQEPNNYAGNEDCGAILQGGIFNDLSCFAKQGYICELQTEGITFDAPCPGGWVARPAQDMFTCYFISNTTLATWQEARDQCKSISTPLDGYLLAINSKDEGAFIARALMNATSAFGWWTGLNDKKLEGYWQYDTAFNNPVLNNVIQWGGEPDNSGGHDYCTVVYNEGRYNDISCNSNAYYVCETSSYPSSGLSVRADFITMLLFFCLTIFVI